MKFHAFTLAFAGVLVAGAASAGERVQSEVQADRVTVERSMDRDGTSRYSYYERTFFVEPLYTDLPSVEEVARKVSDIVAKQRTEIAMLSSVQPAARTAGFNNVATVYDYMIQDHDRLADFGSEWLSERGFSVPATTAEPAAFEGSPEASVEEQIQMHQRAFNEALEMRRNERSSTVRGMLLWAAAGAMQHISLLQTLDRDIEMGRRSISARLNSMMDGNFVASNTNWLDQIIAEDRAYFESIQRTTVTTTTTPPTTAAETTVPQIVQVIEVERPVERIVEKPVIVERVVERVVERPVYVERPVVRSRVAGQRQTTPRRRPAK
ncbi:MAG: hypothetical protein ACK47B_13750 [Armatimonadota bacterium]